MPINDIAVNALMESERIAKLHMAEEVTKWTSLALSERQITGRIKEACCPPCQALFSGDIENGFKLVDQDKPVEMTDEPPVVPNGGKTSEVVI